MNLMTLVTVDIIYENPLDKVWIRQEYFKMPLYFCSNLDSTFSAKPKLQTEYNLAIALL